jgi:hypothetical protein
VVAVWNCPSYPRTQPRPALESLSQIFGQQVEG